MAAGDDAAAGAAAPLEIYRSLFVAYPDALLLVDPAGLIVLANPQARELLGYAEHELVGLSVDALVPAAIRPRHAAYRRSYGDHPRARPMGTQMELVARRRDGTEVMVEIALSPLQDQGLPYVVAAVRGIDSYPRVQQALRRARYSECVAQVARMAVDMSDLQEMLQRVPALVADGVQTDAAVLMLQEPGKGEFRVVGAAGLLPGESVDMKGPPTPPSAGDGLRNELAMPLVDREQVIGVLTVRSRQARQFSAEDTQFIGSIASLLANRLQRAHSEQALEHVQRLETVGQLTGGIAHDFNNLLTIIQGNLQVLEDRPAVQADESAAECLAAAMRASYRSAELTNKLLAFSRRQALSPRLLDVPALLHDLAAMLRRTLDRNIDVQLDTQPLHCVADAAQLESALLNLAVNARDAMPGGGVLRLRCRLLAEPSGDLAAELAEGLAQGRAFGVIEVSDTGTGMSPEVMRRAFEPFFTTKALGRGTGLGLSSVFGFVKQSLGTVRLRSEVGQGTTVVLVLPRTGGGDAPARPPGEAPADGAAVPANPEPALPAGLAVLLVEDEAEVRHAISHTLRALGCRVAAVETAEQALAYLDEHDAPALLLSDVALGAGMPGTDLAALVRLRRPAMARLLMSGFMSEARNEARATAADVELLRKPFDRAHLLAAIRRALAAAVLNAPPPPPPAG